MEFIINRLLVNLPRLPSGLLNVARDSVQNMYL
nr:MAG TPA: hypothetical protein [Bacteriophage sp.]